ncbi:MAG: methylmalonyl-CoA decarboxylase subunit alpha [Candidatus Atribacteria bacterium]|nr:methylmalonyl-CoA decarboxylase subunit alpha [Candidatus Atribacteria bacterium]
MAEKTLKELVEELIQKEEALLAGGGPKAIEKRHRQGKTTARERIDFLMDEGSFEEVDLFVKHRASRFGLAEKNLPADGVVTGFGTIDGRLVFIYSQDFTVLGGSLGEMHAQKICKIMDMAAKVGAPVLGINDSGGARIQEGIDSLSGYGKIFWRNTLNSGVIPQIAIIDGPCAGGAVYSPALMDFIFMIEGASKMFVTGPQVVKAATGEEVSAEELGGAQTHARRSGVAHFVAPDEKGCLLQVKRLLSYLPSNNTEDPPWLETDDPLDRENTSFYSIISPHPNKPYDVKKIIQEILDRESFLEVQEQFARNAVVGFGRIGGQVVGIVANQPYHLAGCLDIDAADKIARFVRFCDCFNIPLVTLVDVPGFLPGTNQEFGGIIRHGAKMLFAYSEATVPKITLILRKAYGGAYLAMCSRDLGADLVLAWPTAEIAVMGAEGAVNIVFRKEIENAIDPVSEREKVLGEYRQEFYNPYQAAQRGLVDQVIDPKVSRLKIARALEVFWSKRETGKGKKHGNFPV